MEKQAEYIQTIRDAYPDLIETVHLNEGGQFNDVLIVNGKIIFRFPKSAREAAKLATETALLRSLQSRVSLPIPNPIYQSKDNAPVGQMFMGYHLLPGELLWSETVHALKNEELLQSLANQLATFLRQLHTLPAEELAVKLPHFQGCEEWRDLYNRFRSKLFPFMSHDARIQMTRHFEDFLNDERNCRYEPVLIHGDFGPSNILYNAQTNSISGIIDFSSTEWGDPAVDFAAILCSVSYGEPFLERFSVMYPDIDTLLSRARFYAGTFALQEALFGIEDGDQEAYERGIAEYR